MKAMALSHKISDTVKMHIDWSLKHPVVEIEFRFIRYRLTLDDVKWARELATLINKASEPKLEKADKKQALPRLYKDTKGGAP